MSRYDYRDPGTDPAYCDPLQAEDDIDVPDFDQPDPPVDPAEHASHALIDALAILDKEIAVATTLERANALRSKMKRAWADVTRVTDNAGDKVDRLVERLR